MTKIFNGSNRAITVVTDLKDVVIPAGHTVKMELSEGAVFNTPDGSFYVEEEGAFYVKYADTENCSSGADIEIYQADEELQEEGLAVQEMYEKNQEWDEALRSLLEEKRHLYEEAQKEYLGK